jgi:hypothetical protein
MTTPLPDIRGNLQAVQNRIHRAATTARRNPNDIRLIAVSKYMTTAHITRAIEAGQHIFGENTVQDAMTKLPLIQNPANEWHFIGHLQTNKAKYIPGNFSWFHTLDSIKLARKLSIHAEASGKRLKTLIQVNISDDPDKFGLQADRVFAFVDELLQTGLNGISLHGLMTIGRRGSSDSERQHDFSRLRKLRDSCAKRFGDTLFHELSMGMSNDFETAISEGATMVRVGNAIFGPRPVTGS